MFDDADPILGRVREIALALPDATEVVAHGRPTFRCGKMFANYGGGLKGGKVRYDQSILFIPDESEKPALEEDPRFFVPAYYGPYGWIGLNFRAAEVDWQEVADLVEQSYRNTAPVRLVKQLP